MSRTKKSPCTKCKALKTDRGLYRVFIAQEGVKLAGSKRKYYCRKCLFGVMAKLAEAADKALR